MMKALIILGILSLAIGKSTAEPNLSKDQVSRIGEVVMEKSNREYRGWFDLETPTYDEKSKTWSFSLTREHFPTVTGERRHIFEVRDSDGFVRLGSRNHHGGPEKPELKFKMPNNAGQYIRKIMRE